VLAYAAAAALVASLLFGCLSALTALANAAAGPLQDGTRANAPRPARLRRALVVGELALSLVLLAGAGLLVRSYAGLQAVDPGFDPRGLVTTRISLPDVHYRYRDQGPKIAAFYQQLDERLRALPGVARSGPRSLRRSRERRSAPGRMRGAQRKASSSGGVPLPTTAP